MGYKEVAVETPVCCKQPIKGFEFESGARLIVVEDKGAKRSTAAMSIRVGSLADPPELPGLAHLCEHMLFLGTNKYPNEGAYNTYVTENVGWTNAWTESAVTVYHFDVATTALQAGLDMFLHFFVDPLFYN